MNKQTSKDIEPVYDKKGNITAFKVSVRGLFRLAEFQDLLIERLYPYWKRGMNGK